MKQTNYFNIYILLLPLLVFLGSCKKMDHTYADFIKDGAIVYPGKVDTLLAAAGNNRIQLKWAVPFDGNITSYKVFWNFGSDSLVLQGNKPTGQDSIKMFVDGLTEGTYNFTVHTYDKSGHKSVGENTIGKVYGSIFMSTLYNRPVRLVVKDAKTSTVTVTWVSLDLNCIGTEWIYTKTDGSAGSFFSPLDGTTVLNDCDLAQPISYRSVFIPEKNAIDKFYTVFVLL